MKCQRDSAISRAGAGFRAGLLAAVAVVAMVRPANGVVSYLTNSAIKVGIDTDRGGTITYLAAVADGRDLINGFDLGRMAQQSYYSGPVPFGTPHPSYPNWGWNPVAAGDVYGYRSTIQQWTNDGAMIYVKRVPKQWALANVNSECTTEEWITLEGNVAKVRCRLNNNRSDTNFYGGFNQELPAFYSNPPFTRIFSYTGDVPFTGGALAQIVQAGPPWTSYLATECWSALVDVTNWGVGLYHPNVGYTLAGKAGTGTLPEGYTCGYLSPVLTEHLDHNIVYSYEYYLIVGSLTEIRDYVYAHRPGPLPHWHFQRDRQHWVYANTSDSGWPIEGRLLVNLSSSDPVMLSPAQVWNAADVPKLYVRAKHSAANTSAQLFWQNLTEGGFSGVKSMFMSLIPDGAYHTYALNLALSSSYTGAVKQIRFDPVMSGTAGERMEIEYISAYPFPGDFNRDETVDFRDFATLGAHWGEDRAAGYVGDLDGDRKVDLRDLAVFAKHWLSAVEGQTNFAGRLDGLSYGGGSPVWPAIQLNTYGYTALALLSGVSNQVFGARAGGGMDVIANYGSGWNTYPILGGEYHTLAVNKGEANYAFGAKVGGGVDAIYYFGGWNAVEVNPHDFVSLANVSGVNQFMGVRRDGRLEFTYYNGGSWVDYLVNNTNLYTRVISDPMNGGGTSVYALRADGGIDRVTFNGSAWVTTIVDHSRVYVALTAERTVANWVYGAATSGLYDIVNTGGGFSALRISTNSYKALEHNTGTTYQLFGARADGGGLDAIYFNGSSWVSYQANPNDYAILLHDAYTAGLYAATPPTPVRSR